MTEAAAGRVTGFLFAGAALAAALWLFPVDCDGAAASYDGARYGLGAEALDRGSISAHHPLFHALAMAIALPLRALRVPHAGQYAVRLLSGAGAAWILLQIIALAGPRRVGTGALFGLAVFSGAAFLVLAGSGETVLPAAAAALFALTVASRPGTSRVAVTGALTLALLLRQDNLFVVPGVMAGLAAASPRGSRAATIAKVLAASALATIAGYLAAWIAANGANLPFLEWLLWLARRGSWSQEPMSWSAFASYVASVSKAMIGPFFFAPRPTPWIGAISLAALVVAGMGLRGSASGRRFLLLPAGVTVACWAVFYTWWLSSECQYVVPTIALIAAAMAAFSRGEPAASPVARRAGAVVLLALSSWVLASAAPSLARFRERRLAEAIESTAQIGRGARYVGVGGHAYVLLQILGLEPEGIDDRATLDEILAQIRQRVARTPGRLLVIADRFTMNPAPRSALERSRLPFDSIEDRPGVRFLRQDGLVYGALFEAAGAESR